MKNLCHFSIRLKLQGPVLTKSTAPSSFGLDAAVSRDFKTGRPLIPGTLMKGKVREALHRIGELALDPYFGREGENPSNRGSLFFRDLLAERCGGESRLHRGALDEEMKSTRAEMLRELEAPYRAGEEIIFQGEILRYCDEDTKEADETLRHLRMGLAFLQQIGSGAGTGMGRVLSVDIALPPSSRAKEAAMDVGVLALDLVVKPQGPLCFARHKIGNNLFESEDFIPGAALAGAVMNTAKALGIEQDLLTCIDRIRFRHAFPCLAGQSVRPRTLPLSTVLVGDQFQDVATLPKPVLLRDPKGKGVAPKFPVDWKEPGKAFARLGWAFPARELRVRTAIDAEHLMANKGHGEGGQLFATEVVHPFDDEMHDLVWRTRVDLHELKPDALRLSAAKALQRVFLQLGFLGKESTFCDVEIMPVIEPEPFDVLGDEVVLVLQSPALLADPRYQDIEGVPKDGVLSASQQHDLYAAAWLDLGERSLELSHAFAQQFLAGGDYLAGRFQKGKPYNPWLLTKEGSVFVLRVTDRVKAEKLISSWLQTGLTVPTWARKEYEETWRTNPYLPCNGYGEVALHKVAPTQAFPAAEACELVPLAVSL